MLSLAAVALAGHVGGIPTPARYTGPLEVGEVADHSYLIQWTDNDADPTGRFHFFFQPANVPPSARLGSESFVGQAIPEGADVAVSDPANQLTWDTSAVSAGSYYLYAVTDDPPLTPVYSFAPAPLTIRHAGDSTWPAVIVDEPDGIGDVAGQAYALRWHASGDGPLRATIRYGSPDSAEPLAELVADVPMPQAAGGLHFGCFAWDLSAMPQGYYYVQVQVADPGGRSHAAFSPASVVVYRDASVDAGPPPACELSPAQLDAGTAAADPGTPGACGCHVGGRGETARRSALVMVAIVVATGVAARRRRPRPG